MLVDFLTNTSLAAQLTCMELLGLDMKSLQQLKQWSASRTITLRLKAEERCTFDREITKDVESATKHVTEVRGFGGKLNITDKEITKVTEYFWKFDFSWTLLAYQGNEPTEHVVLRQRSGTYEIVTKVKTEPRPKSTVEPNRDVNISWLLTKLTDAFALGFSIDRTSKKCRTPRRNPDVEAALTHFRNFYRWFGQVDAYFKALFSVQSNHGLDLNKVNAQGTFIPVVPLFEEPESEKKEKASAEKAIVGISALESDCVLRVGDVNHFLVEEKRSLLEKISEIEKMFPAPPKAKIISSVETTVLAVLMHCVSVSQHYFDGVNHVESMLRRQLISAIGKEIQTTDFVAYMLYHNRTLFKPEYAPRPFCYAIRRPDHYPEGIITIDAEVGSAMAAPIQTTVSHSKSTKPMYFPLNAATKVYFGGDRYLHGWVMHEFSGNSGLKLSLTARARQFSCFILMVGRIGGPDSFEPKHAIIIQNKDDLKIPLLLEQIPTPKEFKDAIESLSPEQQRFCKAYRGMQLASTLFGLCVVQIKPQLEKLLNLPDDSLTKEIKLTQNLLELFIKYQIPSDLLSYDVELGLTTVQAKLNAVKSNVSAMQDMINSYRQDQLEEQAKATLAAKLDAPILLSSPPMQTMAFGKSKLMASPSSASGGGGRGGRGGVPPPSPSRNAGPGPQRSALPLKPSAAVAPPPLAPSTPAPSPPIASSKPSESAPVAKKEIKGPATFEVSSDTELDFTQIPGKLDKSFQIMDEDNSLHSTIINFGTVWNRSSQKSLLSKPESGPFVKEQQKKEKNAAFDLLDALSRSGVLLIDAAELHVVVAATHCFDSSLMDTVIQENVNPIEKVERSTLIVAMTVHGKPAQEILKEEQVQRVQTYSPTLFLESGSDKLKIGGSKTKSSDKLKDKGKKPSTIRK